VRKTRRQPVWICSPTTDSSHFPSFSGSVFPFAEAACFAKKVPDFQAVAYTDTAWHRNFSYRAKRNAMATERINPERDNRTGLNREGPTANVPVQRLTATSIIGDGIENPQGESLGKIEDLMVNVVEGRIEYAVIEFGAFLGMGGKLFAVPFKDLSIDPARHKFILNVDKAYLKNAPGFDKTHWPGTNEHSYFENVKLYYGSYVPPFP